MYIGHVNNHFDQNQQHTDYVINHGNSFCIQAGRCDPDIKFK